MKRLLALLLPLFMLGIAGAIHHADPPGWQTLRRGWFDELQRRFPRDYQPVPVRIVDIDDASLAKLGQWPWPRNRMAAMLAALDKAGAAAVGLDIVFAEPDRLSPVQVLSEWKADSPAVIPLMKTARDYDREFAEAIRSGNVATGFVLTGEGTAPTSKAGVAIAGDDPVPRLLNYPGAVVTLPALTEAASGNGALNSLTDADGVLRRMPLVFRSGEALVPSLSAEMLRIAQGARSDIVKTAPGGAIASIRIGDAILPTDAEGSLFLHLTPYRKERYIPAWKLLSEPADLSLGGAIVLIGTSAAGLKDIRATALDPLSAGVEVHAQAIEQMLLGDLLERPDWMEGAELIAMLLAGLGLITVMRMLPALWGAVMATLCVTAAAAVSVVAYRQHHLLIDPLGPSLVLVLIYLVESLRRYITIERERRDIRQAFSHYVSPALLDRLAAHPEALKLGGEMRPMTVLFCDIRGFTAISERYDAEALTRFINRFLTPMTDIILGHQGTIDKYMGDCVMAFWNAPLDDAAHAANACRASLAMQQGLVELNRQRQEEAVASGEPFLPVQIGIGLNTGLCCVGNMGSEQRFDYSVLGDDVNLASRLEGQSKQYGVTCVIGPATQAEAPGMATIELDLIRVKGKSAAVRIHGLLGDETLAVDPSFAATRQAAGELLAAYRGQRWDEAEATLAQVRRSTVFAPETLAGFCALYADRIAACRAEPPAPDWDGVFTAESK